MVSKRKHQCEEAGNEIISVHYGSNAKQHQCRSRFDEPEGSCPAWDTLWFIDQCTKCEMSLFLGLILFCHTDKTLNPLQLFPDDQILPMDAHSCSIPQQLCWALESCIFPSINQQSKTPQELCGQECPVRWQADIRHIWTPCTAGSSLCPHIHIWHAGLSSCRTHCQAHASTPSPSQLSCALPSPSCSPCLCSGSPSSCSSCTSTLSSKGTFPSAVLNSNTHGLCRCASCIKDGRLPSSKFQTWLNSAHLERIHRAGFLASFSLSLTLFLCGFDLRPLLALTWIHVRLIHVTYWCASHPHTFNARGRQASLRTWRHRLKK